MQFTVSRFQGIGRPYQACGLLLAGTALVLSAGPAQQDEEPQVRETISLTRNALEEMVQTKVLIAQTKREWEVDQELLADRIELVKGEIADLKASIEAAAKNAAETQAKLEELREEDNALKEAAAGLAGIVGGLEQRTKDLIPRLPAPISETIRPLSQALPENPKESKASLTERFPRLLGVLNQINKFHRDIHPVPERVALESGDFAEVTALYLGLGQAFYATADGLHAGVGVPLADGWEWQHADHAATEIARAIDIYRKTTEAGFSRVPLTLQ